MPTQRVHMKQLLAREERDNRALFRSLLTAMRPLMVTAEGIPGDDGAEAAPRTGLRRSA
jgi:tRNA 2-thiocytidine biosynthesis protein TtcA